MASRLSVDVGATFTDLLLLDEQSGEARLLKRPSTPDDPSRAVLDCLDSLIEESGVSPGDIATLNLGSTLVDSTIRRGEGARVGLIVTQGFEHLLHLARGRTPARQNGWATMRPAIEIVDLADVVGVAERIDAQGTVVQPLDAGRTREAVQQLLNRDVDAIAVSLLHAYANAGHEKQIRDIVHGLAPDCPVIVSSSTLPEFREYERTLVAVLTAAVRPAVSRDLDRIGERLRARSASPAIRVMRADGSGVSTGRAIEAPVQSSQASAAGALVGAAVVAEAAGHAQAVSLEIGGAATRIGLIRDGRPDIGHRLGVAGQTLPIPAVQVEREALGGASIARVYGGGLLGLGAENAGSVPGPACFGHGGEHATLTDAHAVLGRLPAGLLGGVMRFELKAAEEAVGRIARQLNMDLPAAAQAIVDLADETLLGAVRRRFARERQQAGGFALVAQGGAGPLHAGSLARLTGQYPAIVPLAPGGLSALGYLHAEPRTEFLRSYGRALDGLEPGLLGEVCEKLESKARDWLTGEGVNESHQRVHFEVDLRYGHDGPLLSLPLQPDSLGNQGLSALAADFSSAHRRRYGYQRPDDIELATLRAIAAGPKVSSILRRQERGDPDASVAVLDRHQVWFDDGFVTTAHYDRSRLRCGHRFAGPAIVTQPDATTVVQPGQTVAVDPYLNLLIAPDVDGANKAAGA